MSKKNASKTVAAHAKTSASAYEEFDGEWRKVGLAAPARRALVDAKLYKVSDLRKISLAELNELHGMGKSAIARLILLMDAKKIRFR